MRAAVGSAPAAMAEEALQEREINRTGSGFATLSRKGSRNGRAATNGHAANGHAIGHANGAVKDSVPPVSRRKSLTSNGSELIDVELGEIRRVRQLDYFVFNVCEAPFKQALNVLDALLSHGSKCNACMKASSRCRCQYIMWRNNFDTVVWGCMQPNDSAPVDSTKEIKGSTSGKGMILPFQPMALTFKDVCYYVPYPPVRLFWHCPVSLPTRKIRCAGCCVAPVLPCWQRVRGF